MRLQVIDQHAADERVQLEMLQQQAQARVSPQAQKVHLPANFSDGVSSYIAQKLYQASCLAFCKARD